MKGFAQEIVKEIRWMVKHLHGEGEGASKVGLRKMSASCKLEDKLQPSELRDLYLATVTLLNLPMGWKHRLLYLYTSLSQVSDLYLTQGTSDYLFLGALCLPHKWDMLGWWHRLRWQVSEMWLSPGLLPVSSSGPCPQLFLLSACSGLPSSCKHCSHCFDVLSLHILFTDRDKKSGVLCIFLIRLSD